MPGLLGAFGEYSCKNGYLQIVIHRGRGSACGEEFTVMTACNTFGKGVCVAAEQLWVMLYSTLPIIVPLLHKPRKRPCGWGAQKPCVIRADVVCRITFRV